jgi:hypothetical protein
MNTFKFFVIEIIKFPIVLISTLKFLYIIKLLISIQVSITQSNTTHEHLDIKFHIKSFYTL